MDTIGNFAESLILNEVDDIVKGKTAPPTSGGQPLAPAGIDISNTEVPSSFRKQILSESFSTQEEPPVEALPELVWAEPEEKAAPVMLSEESIQELIPLLHEVKGLLSEMMSAGATMSGNIGTNMAGPQKDTSWATVEKKYGYITPKPAKNRKDILKQAIRSKLRKKK